MNLSFRKTLGALALCALAPLDAPAQPGAPASALPTPVITGPLQGAPPNSLELLSDLYGNGVVTGAALWQGTPQPGDHTTRAALSNGQVYVQKTTGFWQFYVQAGAYTIPALGTPSLSTGKTTSDLWGPVPQAYLKLAPAQQTSIQIGALPSMVGAECIFSFQGMNIQRGLLWNQENSINRGIQINQAAGKFAAALSWNDCFYSNRYSCLSGSLSYTSGSHSLAFSALGNLSQTAFRTAATPVQNNGSMYAVVYTFTQGKWTVQPYAGFTSVPTNPKAGIEKGASTAGAAVLLNRRFKGGFAMAARWEYIDSTGSAAERSVNLLYGPGSSAWSVTVTPTYQYDRFFIRADISYVRAEGILPGFAFGAGGNSPNQPRGMLEAGILF